MNEDKWCMEDWWMKEEAGNKWQLTESSIICVDLTRS